MRDAAKVLGPASIDGDAIIEENAWVSGGQITGMARIAGNTTVRQGEVFGL